MWLYLCDERHLELGGHPFEEVVNFSVNPSVRKPWIGLVGDSRKTETRGGTSKGFDGRCSIGDAGQGRIRQDNENVKEDWRGEKAYRR